jgi:hypothetical protein
MIVLIAIAFSCGSTGGAGLPDGSDLLGDGIENLEPVAHIEADRVSGEAPLEVVFTGSGSHDPEGDMLSFFWDFGDGTDSVVENPIPHVFDTGGLYTVTLVVEDAAGKSSVATVTIDVLPDDGVFTDEEEGVVAGLTLDENIDQTSPAEVFGDPQWVDGIDGTAMEFDAEGEYILLPDADELDLTDQGTIEVWLYPYSNITAAGIVHKGVELDYSDESYSLQYNQPGQVAFIITNEAGMHTYVISNEERLSTNTWHHVVVAWDLNEVYMYIDRDLVTNRGIYANGWRSDLPADFAPARDSDGGLMIGSQIPYNYRFDGVIDNVMLYDRVLDAAEVEAHYDALMP